MNQNHAYIWLFWNSSGYILADEGYDVWLGNFRGNVYSRNHEKATHTMNPEKVPFWNFSFDEMGRYDLPAMIKWVWKPLRSTLWFLARQHVFCSTFSKGRTNTNFKSLSLAIIHKSLRPSYNTWFATFSFTGWKSPIYVQKVNPIWKCNCKLCSQYPQWRSLLYSSSFPVIVVFALLKLPLNSQ